MEIIYSSVKDKTLLWINDWMNSIDRLLQRIYFIRGKKNVLEDRFARTISKRSERFMRTLPDMEMSQKIIEQGIDSNNAFALIRFGLYEYLLCYQFLEIKNDLREDYSDFIRYHIAMDAGMFSNDSPSMNEYAAYLIENISYVDILAYWRNYPEKLVFKRFYSEALKHIPVDALYPYPFWHSGKLPSWQLKLIGKKVLVVSSFSKTIEKQYKKRYQIWGKYTESILPEFQLIPFQAVQTCGNEKCKEANTWKEAFNNMLHKVLQIDFDIALISCGSYGMPLALELKKAGKKAIQWGGCFQLWFGIMGSRWENDERIFRYVNDEWVYPDESEVPPMAKLVAGGSYWGLKSC